MPGAVRMIFPAMGTVNSISIFDAGQQGAAISARDLVMRLERYLSLFRPESELSRFNALPGGTWMPVSEDTFALFCASVHYGRITDGAFDVTAGPLTALWRDAIKEQRIPADSEIISRKRLVDYKAISLDDGQGRVRLRCDGQSGLSPEAISKMDWLCDNVDGTIPAFDELLPGAREMVRLLGLYRDELPTVKEEKQL